MTSKIAILLAAAAILPLGACQKATPANKEAKVAGKAKVDASDPLASAMAAAPASVSANATIIQAAADNSMKTLRQGSNGWTCMPDNPETPGHDPMCMDANG